MQLEYMLYSSKDYLFPDEQFYPHGNWEDSVRTRRGAHPQEAFLRSFFPYERSTTLGLPSGDHVFLFSSSPVYACASDFCSSGSQWVDLPLAGADAASPAARLIADEFSETCSGWIIPGSPVSTQQPVFCEGGLEGGFFNMMMYDMRPEVAAQFFNDGAKTAESVTVAAATRREA